MRRIFACLVIGLLLLTAGNLYAVIEISGKCMNDCQDSGGSDQACKEQCTLKSEPGVSPMDNKPKNSMDCMIQCRKQGNVLDFCRSICN
jgi:hypothetical protein